MRRKQIRKLVKGKMADISDAVKDVSARFDKDDIHRFRVAVKSLRSFFRLYWKHTGNTQPAIPRKFLKLYHIAGDIRDLQLEWEMHTESKKIPGAYLDSMLEEIEKKKQEWGEYHTLRIMRKAGKLFTEYEYETLPVFALNDFITGRVAFIDQSRQKKRLGDEEIHSIRKLVKDVIYTTKLAKKDWNAAYKNVHNLPEQPFNELATEIGNFNDGRLMLEHMADFDTKGLKPRDLKLIKLFRDNMRADIRKHKRKVVAELAKLDMGMVY